MRIIVIFSYISEDVCFEWDGNTQRCVIYKPSDMLMFRNVAYCYAQFLTRFDVLEETCLNEAILHSFIVL